MCVIAVCVPCVPCVRRRACVRGRRLPASTGGQVRCARRRLRLAAAALQAGPRLALALSVRRRASPFAWRILPQPPAATCASRPAAAAAAKKILGRNLRLQPHLCLPVARPAATLAHPPPTRLGIKQITLSKPAIQVASAKCRCVHLAKCGSDWIQLEPAVQPFFFWNQPQVTFDPRALTVGQLAIKRTSRRLESTVRLRRPCQPSPEPAVKLLCLVSGSS